ncbi:hypothetical protein N0V91_000114 [Didymella pomorum]|uniref:Uncharacterized protein n=1 Tax=Didymella pomorum TaxID=749634 RepID=A0A9W9DBK5_9PLEO|nr:hypothetical protein N0V91_000114 [Didymella pomorum]
MCYQVVERYSVCRCTENEDASLKADILKDEQPLYLPTKTASMEPGTILPSGRRSSASPKTGKKNKKLKQMKRFTAAADVTPEGEAPYSSKESRGGLGTRSERKKVILQKVQASTAARLQRAGQDGKDSILIPVNPAARITNDANSERGLGQQVLSIIADQDSGKSNPKRKQIVDLGDYQESWTVRDATILEQSSASKETVPALITMAAKERKAKLLKRCFERYPVEKTK